MLRLNFDNEINRIEMSSIIPGYTYDIFISYRQKDNKGDRWVSEFVEALKAELEATFKEDISIYFDENPHDGLLETHDVDASLKEKLKCLIFIPIISRTYCDPRSFAWENEYKAFVEYATHDQPGLKVTLPNGNIAARVLPIRIHDIDVADIKLYETVLGGVLRSVDFIYKSAGVNRPLRSNEDHPKDNLNKTYYRDQINKVANAIDDIIRSLRSDRLLPAEGYKETADNVKKARIMGRGIFKTPFVQKPGRILLILISVLICLLISFMVLRSIYMDKTERRIAFIPLRILNNDYTLITDGDNFMEAVNDKLNFVKSITVVPRISTLQYRDTEKSLDVIRKELNINYLLDGSIRLEENKVNIWIQLSAAKDNKVLWSKKYIWDKNQISEITREIVRVIAGNLDIKLSSEEIKQIDTEPTKSPDANLNYISANVISNDAWFYYNYGNKMLDSTSFNSAIITYDKAIEFDSLFAQAYARRAIASSWGYYTGELDSTHIRRCKEDIEKALSLNKDLKDAQIALGFYYYYCKNDFRNALIHFNTAAELDPEDYQPLFYMALVYRRMGDWKTSKGLLSRVIRYNLQEPLFLTNIGLSYAYLHDFDSALIYHQKAIDAMPGWSAPYKNKIQTLLLKHGNTPEAGALLDKAIRETGENLAEYRIILDIYRKKYTDALQEAEKSRPADFNIPGSKYIYMAMTNRFLNNPEISKTYFDSALVILSNDLLNDPGNHEIHGATGVAYAGLGNKAKALEEGKKAVKLATNNSMDESDMKINLARIYTMTGDYRNALSTIENVLKNPSVFSIKMVQLDPVWQPLTDLPQFKAMLRQHSGK